MEFIKKELPKIIITFLLGTLMTLNINSFNSLRDEVKMSNSQLNCKIDNLNNMVFTHLTNHDMHVPREQLVSKAEYQMFCNKLAEERATIERILLGLNEKLYLISKERK